VRSFLLILTAVVLLVSLIALLAASAVAQFPPAPGTGPGLAETIEAIDNARVTTRVLYVTAHPDDESAALLTYLARGAHANVALLTLTRGEGGQNDLGPEQAPQLGLIRTQELLAATRGYGVKLFFANAPDFGYSKTPEETQKVWGDSVLGEMVRVIRTFRPDIVINGWGGVHGGHGHHQTSGLWTPRAVKLAADPKAFTEQFAEGLRPWGGEQRQVQILDTERGGASSPAANGYTLPVDEISPLWGKSWREIGFDAFVNHRSQGIAGFLGSPFLRRPLVLVREDGNKLDRATLAEPLRTLAGDASSEACRNNGNPCSSLRAAENEIGEARAAALALDWRKSCAALAQAAEKVTAALRDAPSGSSGERNSIDSDLQGEEKRIEHALALTAGIEINATANRGELVGGETFDITASARCREEAGCSLGELRLALPGTMHETKREGDGSKGWNYTIAVNGAEPSLSAWDKLQPEPPPLVIAKQAVTIGGYAFEVSEPVMHIQASSTRVDRVPLRIVPAYTLAVEPKQTIEVLEKPHRKFDVLLRVHSYATQASKITAGLDVPDGFSASPPVEIAFDGAGDRYAKLTVSPPTKLAAGNYPIRAYAKRENERFTTSLEPLQTIPTLFWSEPAQCVVHAFDVRVPENLRVGYITAEGEPIPDALRMLGMRVETLDAQALAFGDLSKFNAIVVGVRAYELRPELPGANQRLLDYVSNGGTLVVQYNRDFIWDKLQPAPYPALISPPLPPAKAGDPPAPRPLPRITDENSPVKFLKPDDPLLTQPNRITQDDFKGWVQERGLYFWTRFDPKYTPVLAMNDPGEPDLNGALVYARYGKGTYIYTGIAFFRQLPESVPGAYRLFVNLLSASHTE
jgi:LmbE family N-acetylglucosaminyl deacetylase